MRSILLLAKLARDVRHRGEGLGGALRAMVLGDARGEQLRGGADQRVVERLSRGRPCR